MQNALLPPPPEQSITLAARTMVTVSAYTFFATVFATRSPVKRQELCWNLPQPLRDELKTLGVNNTRVKLLTAQLRPLARCCDNTRKGVQRRQSRLWRQNERAIVIEAINVWYFCSQKLWGRFRDAIHLCLAVPIQILAGAFDTARFNDV